MATNSLIRKRAGIKRRLTNFINFLEPVKELYDSKVEISQVILIDLQARIDRLDTLFFDFNEIQDQIESAVLEEELETHYLERDSFENLLNSNISSAKLILQKYVSKDDNVSIHSNNLTNDGIFNSQNVKLPVIELPKFNGDFNKWLEFKDTYVSLIHTNQQISDVQKYHYLRASVKGDANNIIQNVQLSAANYETAWRMLCTRFDNERLLVNNHVKAIFNMDSLSKSSSTQLRNLIDTLYKNLRSLSALGQNVEAWDTLLLYILTTKFDNFTAQEWEKYKGTKDIVTMKDMETFLQKRADMLESLEINVKDKDKGIKVGHKKLTMYSSSQSCPVCNGSHLLYQCSEFLKMSTTSKRNKAQELRLCYNCLYAGHSKRTCRSKRNCNVCKQRHHTILHIDDNVITNNMSSTIESTEHSENVSTQNPQISLSSTAAPRKGHVLLSTITVIVCDAKGNALRVKALLDSGSQSNYVSEKLQKRLHTKLNETQVEICGINGTTSKINVSCDLEVQSIHNNYSVMMSCYVLPVITEKIPSNKINISKLKIPSNIQLADPTFGEPSQIDLLIGAELFWNVLGHKRIYMGKNLPILQETKFGYLVSGMIDHSLSKDHCYFSSNIINSELSLQETMQKFWEIEELHTTPKLSPDEETCEDIFKTTHTRTPDGRFVVRIPLKYPPTKLGDSRKTAKSRLLSLERRFLTNPSLRKYYIDFLQEYEDMGHMTLVKNPKIDDKEFLLPHHGVFKESSLTTKLRVVFNGSSRTSTGWSLNDLQYTGPAIHNDIVNILVRFRLHNIVVSADVTKMYRQILVNEEDRSLQRILWRQNIEDPIQTYNLCTVTYGLKSAPYLALRCFKQVAMEHEDDFPIAAKIISQDFYVDDLLTGFSTCEEAVTTCTQISNILNKGCFPLRKWTSNSKEFLSSLQIEEDPVGVLLLGNNDHANTLGVKWFPGPDSLSYCIKEVNQTESVTKRTILSDIAKLFDPIGLVSPCIITAKIIMQLLWTRKLDWDDDAPTDIASKWRYYRDHLYKLNNLRIPRHALCINPIEIEYHGFCDASQVAYGACIYIRSVSKEHNIHVRLLIAKTRVAPLKMTCIPRLELCSALLLARLMKRIRSNINLPGNTFLWSDSKIVLCWLNINANLLQPFVANRISEIQSITGSEIWTWNHVGSKENPADLCSRGVSPDFLAESTLWWNGPKWLSSKNYVDHISQPKLDIEIPEMKKKKTQVFVVSNSEPFLFGRFSTLKKLQRVTAYCLRFIYNLRNKTNKIKDSPLTAHELTDSLSKLIKLAQTESFHEEIALIKANKDLRVKHNLLSLSPFLDPEGILRVGGRLKYSHLRFETKHPILLSGKHNLTKLIFEEEHKKLLHAGAQLLLANVRQRYWPTSGLNVAKSTIRNCLVCFKFKPKTIEPLMAHLPEDRVKKMYPFSITGVDYAGPIMIRERRGRSCKFIKCYISLFICFTTKCIHLELVSDLTSDAFLAALRRFISRRGKPSVMYSDNGTNFIGIQKELKFLRTFFEQSKDEILNFCANDNITWNFIPPNSPHFGGLWESGVKSVKHHLHRAIGDTKLTYEELLTVLIQIESIVNSRPLYPLSSDPNDLLPLTPAHFIIGRTFTTLPDPDITSVPLGRLSRYQLLQQLYQSFWKGWSTQYLTNLQQKHKWKKQSINLTIDTLVLVKQDNLPPCNWLLGRVTEVHPGKDNIVRVATIKTNRGLLKRAVTKLCPLPNQEVSTKQPESAALSLSNSPAGTSVSPPVTNASPPATSLGPLNNSINN